LHEGNLYNFLCNWLWARVNKGKVLLRIDDADASRFRPTYLDDIFRTLEWMGLDWDLGPSGPDDFMRNWSQSTRMPQYQQLLFELREKGLVFACACSRKQLADAGAGTIYPGTCQGKGILLDAEDVSWRFALPGEGLVFFEDRWMGKQSINLKEACGSFLVRRRDGIPAYQICSLADDLFFGVTHAARGRDLLVSTACQMVLAAALNKTEFLHTQFIHHPLLLDEQGEKLSKSAGNALGNRGMKKEELHALLGRFAAFVGLREHAQALTLEELLTSAKEHNLFAM
jgi:glutamyl-tRNA synthetase